MAHIQHLKSAFPLQGKSIVDIGAGDGTYSRRLHDEGADVIAIEIDAEKVARAKQRLPREIDVRLGAAEDLPLENRSCDLACFFFSLHHVPVESHLAAFDEVCRVVKPEGRLHVVEPYPHGTMFDVVRMVEDETFVRTNSHKILGQLDKDPRFRLIRKHDYVLTREYPTFDFFLDKIVRPDPERSASYAKAAARMEAVYEKAIETIDGRRVLHQPCAAYHFEISPAASS